jgi:hypothetical protein
LGRGRLLSRLPRCGVRRPHAFRVAKFVQNVLPPQTSNFMRDVQLPAPWLGLPRFERGNPATKPPYCRFVDCCQPYMVCCESNGLWDKGCSE